jgi:ABC-2 type transport system permease protein
MNVSNIALKDISLLIKDKGQLFLLFGLPVAFILAFTAAFAAGTQIEEELITVPVVNLDSSGEMTTLLLQALNDDRGLMTEEIAQADAEAGLTDESIAMALTIPPGFSAEVKAGKGATLALNYGPSASESELRAVRLVVDGVASDLSLETQLVGGLSQMAAMMSDAPADAQVFTAERIEAQAASQFERSRTTPMVSLRAKWPDQITQGREDWNPSSFGVAGFAVMFAFITAQATASSIFDEKKEGTFRRLLAAPMQKWELLTGKMVPNLILAILQVVVIFVACWFLLPLLGVERFSFGNSPLGVALVTLLVALCSTTLGLLLAALCRTESQVGGISSLVLWVAGMVGGAFIPNFLLGDFLGTVGKVVPHYWANQAFNDLMIRGQGVTGILPELAVLAGFAGLFFVIGLWRFRFD